MSTPASKIIRTRGGTIAVTANADIMFMPGGQVYGWTRRLSNAIQRGTEAEAPTNKRPRWQHYGKPLKATITSAPPKFRNAPRGPRVYAAVGSSAPHAAYVDQGTGVFAGGSPWKAKILPPYAEGSPSLYEHTWHPPGQTANHTVMIKGQRPANEGRGFFGPGLQRGFQQMRMRSYQRPGVDPRMGDILRTWPRELENFGGNTQWSFAFDTQLRIWRSWRDEAFDVGRSLGQGSTRHSRNRAIDRLVGQAKRRQGNAGRRARRALLSKIRSQERRDRLKAQKAKSIKKVRPPRDEAAQAQALQAAAIAARVEKADFFSRHPYYTPFGKNTGNGFYYQNARGVRQLERWSGTVLALFRKAGVKPD